LPEAFPLDDQRKAGITLGQLLCMTSGDWGEGQSPVGIVDGKVTPLKPVPGQNIRDLDLSSLRVPLWTNPGEGYSYSSPAPHIASIVLRHVTGMELQEYINERLSKPMGWGAWGYCLHRGDSPCFTRTALEHRGHATDALLLRLLLAASWQGRKQPARRLRGVVQQTLASQHYFARQPVPENNSTDVAGAPHDSFTISAGGFGIFIVPSLDLVVYKLGGNNGHDPALTAAAAVRPTAPATTGSPSRERRLTKAASAETMACVDAQVSAAARD
jgi:CubicO group peptidase (beta-lactamase class C family)